MVRSYEKHCSICSLPILNGEKKYCHQCAKGMRIRKKIMLMLGDPDYIRLPWYEVRSTVASFTHNPGTAKDYYNERKKKKN